LFKEAYRDEDDRAPLSPDSAGRCRNALDGAALRRPALRGGFEPAA
jgi:hypothetical protein